MELLTMSNTKILKGSGRGYMSCILHLAPAASSGNEVCPKRTPGCTAACLNYAGRGQMKTVQAGRLRKTRLYFEDRDLFMGQLIWDINAGIRKAEREDATPCFRLNGTSDIPWSAIKAGAHKNIFEAFPAVQFYDYTAVPNRFKNPIPNYHLTFSVKENNDKDVIKAIANGANIAAVFNVGKDEPFPTEYMGLPVISGDDDDLRFLDPHQVCIGLRLKGGVAAKKAARQAGFAKKPA